MLPREVLILALFYCCIRTGDALRQGKGLFPAASRMKRGLESAVNPTFHSSLNDAHLLFEIMLAGTQFEDSGGFRVEDAELASMRKTKSLKVICEESVPRKLPDVLALISDLSNHSGPLQPGDFERITLTMAYTAQRAATATTGHQRDVWIESFVCLYKALKQDLIGTH